MEVLLLGKLARGEVFADAIAIFVGVLLCVIFGSIPLLAPAIVTVLANSILAKSSLPPWQRYTLSLVVFAVTLAYIFGVVKPSASFIANIFYKHRARQVAQDNVLPSDYKRSIDPEIGKKSFGSTNGCKKTVRMQLWGEDSAHTGQAYYLAASPLELGTDDCIGRVKLSDPKLIAVGFLPASPKPLIDQDLDVTRSGEDTDTPNRWAWDLKAQDATGGRSNIALAYKVKYSDPTPSGNLSTEDALPLKHVTNGLVIVSVPVTSSFDWPKNIPVFIASVGGLLGWLTSVKSLRKSSNNH